MNTALSRPDAVRAGTLPGPVRWVGLALGITVVLGAVEWAAIAQQLSSVAAVVAVMAYLLATAGSFAAAQAFTPGDHLRRAWLFLAAAHLALAVGRLFWAHDLLGLPDSAATTWLRSTATLLSNAGQVTGVVLFALTWRYAGLPWPGSRREQVAVASFLAVVSLSVTGPHLVGMTALAFGGDVYAAAQAVGDACDVAVFLLITPVFLTARAFSGGSLAWPFGLLAASNFTWLLVDGLQPYLPSLPSGLGNATTALLRTLACLLLAAAGMSHRSAIRGAGRKGTAPP